MTTPAQQMGVPAPELALGQSTLAVATWAARAYSRYDLESVRRITAGVADAGARLAERFAAEFVADTGYGVVPHQAQEIVALCQDFTHRLEAQDYVSPRLSPFGWSVPRPAGVVLALPGATTAVPDIFRMVLQCLLTRNAVVVYPNPRAQAVSSTVAAALAAATTQAGAPEWTVAWLDEPSPDLVELVTGDPRVSVVLRGDTTTRGVPVVVDSTVDLQQAAYKIVESAAFNNSLSNNAERMLIATDDIADELLGQLGRAGAQLLSAEEAFCLRRALFPAGKLDPDYVGQSAEWIAKRAGLVIDATTTVLLVPVQLVVPEEPLTNQNRVPVLGFVTTSNIRQAISLARAVLSTERPGTDLCAALHSNDPTTILEFSTSVQARRLVINHGCSQQGVLAINPNLVRVTDVSWRDTSPSPLPDAPFIGAPRSASTLIPTYPFASNDPRFRQVVDRSRT